MEEPISKSQKKRDADALQKLGVELVALPQSKLETLPLTDSLLRAILEARNIKSHGAMRRQAQLIGKLMRSADSENIRAAYDAILEEGNSQTAAFHALEQWRDRLILDDKDTLTAFIEEHPQVDVQQLRQLLKKAVEEKKSGKPPGAGKALFRFLRSCL
ncbi:ribosome biogenesis factor YjgA [Legionella sp. CNM-4043-24]|uniref:ribosome biogenesis factor YjgA n=1 Tax=Legionella sp. CNM-4043-24 TaxID=3421646 RepID=UPI00403A9C24